MEAFFLTKGKDRSGGGNGMGVPAEPAPASALALQAQIADCAALDLDQLKALLRRVLDTPHLDLKPLLDLPPRILADLGRTEEWGKLLDAMVVSATLDREDRYTKSQWRALGFQRRSLDQDKAGNFGGNRSKRTKTPGFDDAIEVEPEPAA